MKPNLVNWINEMVTVNGKRGRVKGATDIGEDPTALVQYEDGTTAIVLMREARRDTETGSKAE